MRGVSYLVTSTGDEQILFKNGGGRLETIFRLSQGGALRSGERQPPDCAA